MSGDVGAEARVKGGRESCGHAEERRFRQGAQHIQQPREGSLPDRCSRSSVGQKPGIGGEKSRRWGRRSERSYNTGIFKAVIRTLTLTLR